MLSAGCSRYFRESEAEEHHVFRFTRDDPITMGCTLAARVAEKLRMQSTYCIRALIIRQAPCTERDSRGRQVSIDA